MAIQRMNLRRGVQSLVILSLILIPPASSVQAQTGREVSISAPDLEYYPNITFYLDVNNREGSRITDLEPGQITLRENDQEQELLDFQALSPGIELVAAFNLSNPFAIQDINGQSRMDYIKQSLLFWAAQPEGSAPDNLSIISNDGLEHTHFDQKTELVEILEGYNPNVKETESNFNVLAQAISLASDPLDQPGMKRVVLFYTSQPTVEDFAAIDNLEAQAIDHQVLIYTVLVSSPAFFSTAGATKLQSLSAATGGVFLPFSGEEPLADLGQLLEPLRSTYLLTYHSRIVTPGTHTLEVEVSSALSPAVGVREFFLDIRPPNPVFITPPRKIIREIQENPLDPTDQTYQPETIPLTILLEFPDLHPRDLEELIFRVDGEVVERRTTPPYEEFIWDLSSYQTSATHYLSLEAVDILGLSRVSVETPVEIEVIVPPPDLTSIISENAPALAGLAVILVAGLALFFLISQGRFQPGANNVFQSLSLKWVQLTKSRTQIRKVLPAGKGGVQADPGIPTQSYRLIPIDDFSQRLFPEPIRVTETTIKIGNSSADYGIQLQHPSVIREHASITCLEDGKIQVVDLGSTAGTWINYEQIKSGAPQFLKDGDIIHFGEVIFRLQVMARLDTPLVTEEKRLDPK